MKKLLYLFTAAGLLSACSESDDTTPTPENTGLLLQQQIETVGEQSGTSAFGYNGYKITSQTDDVKSFTYEYTGNLITKITFQAFDHVDHKREQLLQYDAGGNLVQMVELYHYGPNAPSAYRSVYTHHANQTITYEQFKGDFSSQEIPNGSGTYFLNPQGDVTKITQYNTNGDLSLTLDMTHDTKKTPFGNVAGYDKLFYINDGKTHNITQIILVNQSETIEVTNTYEYNQEDYPVHLTVVHQNSSGPSSTKTIQYIYN